MLLTSITISFIIYLVSCQNRNGKGGNGKGGEDGTERGSKGANNDDNNVDIVTSIISDECGRHRKPWHELSSEERELYINGFLQLSENGKLSTFVEQHASEISAPQSHSTAAFLPWHRYLLWEFETAFRSLGDQYECYSLPYWDWTYETTQTSNITDFVILNSGLGHFGNPGNEYCLEHGNFSQGQYTPFNCDFNDEGECCLTRGDCQSNEDSVCIFQTPQQAIEIIVRWDVYGTDELSNTFNGYRFHLENGAHGQAHNFIGATGHLSNLFYSPDDPIFYLLHGFVDYLWALWVDCKDYDEISKNEITQNMYGGTLRPFRNRGPSRIDDELIFTVLTEATWTYIGSNNGPYTPRDLHNITEWGVSYEKGSFWESADVMEACPVMNEKWFYNEDDYETVIISNAAAENGRNEETTKEMVRRKARESSSGRYAKDSLNLLKDKYGWKDVGVVLEREMLFTWSEMTCEFNQLSLKKPCKRPRYWDDCSDMEINEITEDIEISLEEMLNKVSMSECMMSTRKRFYEWALKTHTLLALCRGDYDIFCDDRYLFEDEEHQCLAQINKLLNRRANDGINNNKKNNLDEIRMNSLYYNNNNGITEIQRLVLNAVLNGLVIIFIIAFIAIGRICYMFYFSNNAISMSLQNVTEKMKYGKLSSSDDSDIDDQQNIDR